MFLPELALNLNPPEKLWLKSGATMPSPIYIVLSVAIFVSSAMILTVSLHLPI
jgi:hypothetical protein